MSILGKPFLRTLPGRFFMIIWRVSVRLGTKGRANQHHYSYKSLHFTSFLRIIFAWLAPAWARAGSELDKFSIKAELFREINGLHLLSELGDPTFFFHLFKENTALLDISKLEEFLIIQFSHIPIDSLLQSDFRPFTGSVQTLDLPIISLRLFLRQL